MRLTQSACVVAVLAMSWLPPCATQARAQCRRTHDALGWAAPDHVKLQTGGMLGMLTLGVGYEALSVLALDGYYGWVPEAVGGTEVHSVAARVAVRSKGVCLTDHMGWRILSIGTGALLTFGDGFFVTQPDRYPPRYYRETALRGFVSAGTMLELLHPESSVVASTGAFIEVTALDVRVFAWGRNLDTLSFWDLWSLSLGLNMGF